jgi:hypothetical protein
VEARDIGEEDWGRGNRVKQESSSFSKKRTKKLLFLEICAVSSMSDRRQGRRIKSFLLLFIKKEGLACARSAFTRLPWAMA